MGDVIVIAGKGGTGKTTVSALLTLMLARRKQGSVLAVDADPNSNLAEALGVRGAGSIADIIDEVAKKPEIVPASMGKDGFIEYKIHGDISENKGFDLLVMGRPEGPGCYCYINNVLRNCTANLIKDYSFVVIDNEAGMEHFSRKTTRACNELIVVSDETVVGLKAAHRILDLIEEIGIGARKRYLVINKAKTQRGPQEFSTSEFKVDKIFRIPYDEEVALLSSKGASLAELKTDSSAGTCVEALGDEIWPKK